MATNRKPVSDATKSAASPRRGGRSVDENPLSELPSFRLHLLSRLTDQHAEASYQREVGLKLLECRVIGVVGRHAPIGFKALCERAELEKSNASRLVASLIERGCLLRQDDPLDQRSFLVSLSAEGQRLRTTIHRLAVARNEQWLSVLDDTQREVLSTCLARLTAQSRRMLAGDAGTAPVLPEDVEPERPRVAWIDQRLAEQLHSLLGAALGKPAPDSSLAGPGRRPPTDGDSA